MSLIKLIIIKVVSLSDALGAGLDFPAYAGNNIDFSPPVLLKLQIVS